MTSTVAMSKIKCKLCPKKNFPGRGWGWGWGGGWVVGLAEIKANSAQLELELGLSLAIYNELKSLTLSLVGFQNLKWGGDLKPKL